MVLVRAIAGLVLALIPLRGAATVAGCQAAPGYRAPVTAAISDPFRAPATPFGPGNRGLEYATSPGAAVAAIGPGVVVFAGQVGGRLFVTVRHGDGLRSSYSFLADVLVRPGDAVGAGTIVARAGPVFQLGVRCGDVYVDPAALFAAPIRARLVPDHFFTSG